MLQKFVGAAILLVLVAGISLADNDTDSVKLLSVTETSATVTLKGKTATYDTAPDAKFYAQSKGTVTEVDFQTVQKDLKLANAKGLRAKIKLFVNPCWKAPKIEIVVYQTGGK